MDDETKREEVVYVDAIRSLRYGFFVAAGLFIVGVAWSLFERQQLSSTVLPFRQIPGELRDGNPAALIDLSILALLIVPVITVITIAVNFIRLGERRYALFATLVLIILFISITLSALR